MIIQHNLSAINAQRQFNITNSSKVKSVEKLSSGYKINRAADDASGLAISEKMRRQIRGLDRAAENIQDGVSLCNVADGALNEVHDIFQRERKLLIQAANDTNSKEDRDYIQQEIDALSDELDRIFDDTDFNGIYLFKGHDKYIDDPDIETNTYSDVKTDEKTVEHAKQIKWVDKDYVVPSDVIEPPKIEKMEINITEHEYEERTAFTDEHGHTAYDIEKEDTIEVTVSSVTSQHSITYEKASDTIKDPELISNLALQETQKAIRNDGYVNMLRNDAGTLSLSCGMSQLGIRILDPSTGSVLKEAISLYDLSGCGTTVYNTAANTATTTYDLGKLGSAYSGIKLIQTVSVADNVLINGKADKDNVIDTYKMAYSITNNSGKDYGFEMRMAFDTMNTMTTEREDASNSYTLSNDTANITVKSNDSTLTRSVMTDISKLYGNWDCSGFSSGATVGNHTGAGFWYKINKVSDGVTASVGNIEYGNVTYNKVPMKYSDKTVYNTVDSITTIVTSTKGTIMPTYLDIQSGADAWQTIPIRLWDLNTESLGMVSGLDISAHTAAQSLDNIDSAFERINEIRSYYGAMTNRLEHAYNVNKNVVENTQAAESKIRDTDMEKEYVAMTNADVVGQAGIQMLSQANQSKQSVLSLLGQ